MAIVADWGGAVVSPAMWDVLLAAADDLIADAGFVRVDGLDTGLPRMGRAWAVSGAVGMAAALGDKWPACADDLTPEIRASMKMNADVYDAHSYALIERKRMEVNEAMARIFDPVDGVDLVLTASNPDVAFDADGPMPNEFGGVKGGAGNNGKLTFPANLHGNPAISIPAGHVDGLPGRPAGHRAPPHRAPAAGDRPPRRAQPPVAARRPRCARGPARPIMNGASS